jgi:FMN phosphatase YigB (HAD superfamily)
MVFPGETLASEIYLSLYHPLRNHSYFIIWIIMSANMYILFDVDGVLIHTETWSSEYLKRNNLPSDTMKDFFGGIFRECTLGKADLKEIIPPFLEKWRWEGNVDAFLKAWFDFENHRDRVLIEEIQKLRAT